MSLELRHYSLLIVSKNTKFNHTLANLLPEPLLPEARFASSISEAKRLLAEKPYDLVLLNSPLPDGTGVSFAVDLCASGETVALLMVRAETHDEIFAQTSLHGVFTLPKPTSGPAMRQALRWMISARERLRQAERKSVSLEEKMAEIRLVNRAKWVLIESCGMDEPQAHRYLEKRAMDLCETKAAVARKILDGETPAG